LRPVKDSRLLNTGRKQQLIMTVMISKLSEKKSEPFVAIQKTTMQEFAQYTTLFAPVLFFFSGIALVMILNKFIGNSSSNKKAK
jgi:hypothetical protein